MMSILENVKYEHIAILILFIITIMNYILLLRNNKKVKKYKEQYEKVLAKFNSKVDIQDDFQSIYDRLNAVEKKSEETVETVNKYINKIKSNVQKVGFIKYNAYDETENKLSFALALLDDYNNGVLINHIYSKHGSNIYAKLVTESKVEDRISEEEGLALQMAIDDKDFKLRVVGEVKETNKTKKRNKRL